MAQTLLDLAPRLSLAKLRFVLAEAEGRTRMAMLNCALRATPLTETYDPVDLGVSFGVAAFPAHAQSPQQLIAAADTAMYEAKAARKNCVRHAAETAQDA